MNAAAMSRPLMRRAVPPESAGPLPGCVVVCVASEVSSAWVLAYVGGAERRHRAACRVSGACPGQLVERRWLMHWSKIART